MCVAWSQWCWLEAADWPVPCPCWGWHRLARVSQYQLEADPRWLQVVRLVHQVITMTSVSDCDWSWSWPRASWLSPWARRRGEAETGRATSRRPTRPSMSDLTVLRKLWARDKQVGSFIQILHHTNLSLEAIPFHHCCHYLNISLLLLLEHWQ